MFSQKLNQLMEEKGMTASALSAATGVGKSSISQYLSGRNEPTQKRKKILAAALGVEADFFDERPNSGSRDTANNLSVATAARLMRKSKDFVYRGLQDRVFPWGYAVKMENDWSYYISPIKFTEHTGLVVPGLNYDPDKNTYF